MQGFNWVILFEKATKAFCYPAVVTVDGWMVSFSQLFRPRKIGGHLDTAH